jgi:sec-independent protein translocase protein TatC
MNKFLLEIKNRIILMLVIFFLTVLASYLYKEILLFSIFYKNAFIENNNEQVEIFYFIFTDVTEILTVYLKLITFLSYQISAIFFFYHCFVFIIPALYNLEYFYLRLTLKIISSNYLIFIVLSNYFILPIALNFFLSFQKTNILCFHLEAKLAEYISFYIFFYYNSIIYLHFFTLIFLIFNFADIKIKSIKKFRKLCHYFLLISVTLISSPEIITQIILFLVFLFFYELLIIYFLLKLNLK